MKKIIILIVLLAAGYFIYTKFFNYNPLEISDNLIVAQTSGFDINSAAPTPPLKFGYIEGLIENKSEKVLSNILIFYAIGWDTISTSIGVISPGAIVKFKTNRCRVKSASPNYSLLEIKYEDVTN